MQVKSFSSRTTDKMNFVIRLMLFIFGVAFFGLFLGFYTSYKDKSTNWIKYEATITSITSHGNGEDKYYDVYVCYTIEGQYYNVELNTYESGFKVGENVKVFINPLDYTRVVLDTKIFYLLFLGFSVGFIIGVLIAYGITIKNRKKFHEMVSSNCYIRAQFKKVLQKTNYSTKNKHPFILIYEGKLEGETKEFYSKFFWTNPSEFLDETTEELRVYYNPRNTKRYYLDIRKILEKVEKRKNSKH